MFYGHLAVQPVSQPERIFFPTEMTTPEQSASLVNRGTRPRKEPLNLLYHVFRQERSGKLWHEPRPHRWGIARDVLWLFAFRCGCACGAGRGAGVLRALWRAAMARLGLLWVRVCAVLGSCWRGVSSCFAPYFLFR